MILLNLCHFLIFYWLNVTDLFQYLEQEQKEHLALNFFRALSCKRNEKIQRINDIFHVNQRGNAREYF